MTRYTTYGDVQGCCGHRHRSQETAQACSERNARGSRQQGGYSDRSVVIIGENNLLYYDDGCTEPVWPSHGRSTGAVRF